MQSGWRNALAAAPATVRDKFRRSEGARRIVANAGWMAWDRGYRTAVGFIVSIFVARYLGAEGFGLFNYALAFVAVFRVTANLGLEEILVRELVRYPKQNHEILGTAFALRMIGATLTIGLIAFVVQFTRPDDPLARTVVMVASLMTLGHSAMLLQRWNAAQLNAKYNALANNTSLTVVAIAKLLLIYLGAPLIWFVWSNVLIVWLNAAVLFGLYLRSGQALRTWRPRWAWAKQMLGDAWPRIPAGAAGQIQTQLGMLVVGGMVGDAQLGIYSVAFRFYILLLIVPNIIVQSLAPALTRAHQSNRTLFLRRLARTYQLLLGGFAATAAGMILIGLWGVPLIYGEAYADAGLLLLLFALPLLLHFFGQLRMWYIVIENLFQYSMWISFAQIGAAVLANFLLIKWLGITGAVLAVFVPLLTAFAADALLRPARAHIICLMDAIVFWKPLPLPAQDKTEANED
jgi:PST family polysaccharide transporter